MQSKVILSRERDFTTAKEALVYIWKNRSELDLHQLEIKPYKSNRSNDANRYYWGAVIAPMAESLGYTPEELHETLLAEIYGTKMVKFRDKEIPIPNRRSHNMNTAEFATHIQHCERIALEMGIILDTGNWTA